MIMSNKFLVETSARHVHLTAEAVEVLFGAGHQLTNKKDLSQPGQFACEEKVTVIGPKGSLKASILGPARPASQVELSLTDARTIGVAGVPVRESGDIAGSAPITIVGPRGIVTLTEGCIIANRHIHMSPADGARFGVKDGDYINVDVSSGTKHTLWYDVQVRVSDKFALEMHVDTDDANAVGIKNGSVVTMVKA